MAIEQIEPFAHFGEVRLFKDTFQWTVTGKEHVLFCGIKGQVDVCLLIQLIDFYDSSLYKGNE